MKYIDANRIDEDERTLSEEPSKSLEKTASRLGFDYVDNIVHESPEHRWNDHDVELGYRDGFIVGACWQKEQDTREMIMSDGSYFQKCYELGKKDMSETMMKDAVEGEIQMRYSGCLCAKTIRAINEDKFKLGDKVRIIIVKED